MNWPGTNNPASARATAGAVLALALAGCAALHYATAGFRAVSTEAVRRLQVDERPLALPAARLEDSEGAPSTLNADARTAIVSFVYVRCQSVCRALGSELQRMQEAIRARGAGDRVRLVTLSFDPRDDAEALRAWGKGMRADPALWRLYRIADEGERRRLLDSFGVVVVPAPLGEFEHNAAFHLVDRDGRLVRIMDYADPAAALEAALALAAEDA